MAAWKNLLFSLVLAWSIYVNEAGPHRKLRVGVVGGESVDISQFPYQVSVRLGDDHICGGFIVDKKFVTTAAHCCITDADEYSIKVGTSDLNQGGEVYQVDKLIEHPKYDYSGDYDLCILRLTEEIELSEKVAVAELSTYNGAYKKGTVFNITGWGDTEYWGELSTVLLVSEVPLVTQKVCKENYDEITEVNHRMLCAGAEGHDACQGDSGGPLSLDGEVVGVVSRGRYCAKQEYPTIYVRISRFTGWIKKMIAKYSS